MKIIQNTLKIQKKISNVSKKNWVGPQKVGSVGFLEMRHFFGLKTSYLMLELRNASNIFLWRNDKLYY